jgi:hypothetical protein
MNDIQTRITLGQLEPSTGREYEVTIMRAGNANAYTIPADTLRRDATLFEGATSFLDHLTSFLDYPSVTKLAGVIHQVNFDEDRQAVRGQFRVADSPCGDLVKRIVDQIVTDRSANKPTPNIGLSADILIQTDANRIAQHITKVLSVDVVFDPAAGGYFDRVLNHRVREFTDPVSVGPTGATPQGGNMPDQPGADAKHTAPDPAAVQAALHSEELSRLQAASTTELLRVQCANTLHTTVAATDLPEAYKKELRRQFADKIFQPTELTAAIDGLRAIWAKHMESETVQHYGHATDSGKRAIVHGMVTDMDRLQLAAERLFGLPIPPDKEDIPRLSGIRELYHLLSGDYQMQGVFDPQRVTFANATTSTMASLVANIMNKVIATKWDLLGREGYNWYEQIAFQETLNSLQDISWITVGGFGDLPTVSEGASYTELTWDDKYETTAFVKKGGFIGLTLEMLDKDQTGKVRQIPSALATAGIRTLSNAVATLFTANGALIDGQAWFHSTLAIRGGDGATPASGNLGTTALAAAEWLVAAAAIFKATELNSGKRLGLRPRFCLVPIDLAPTANDIFKNDWVTTDNKHYTNLLKGTATPLVVPEWTDKTDWYAITDPNVYPCVGIGYRYSKMPEVFIANDQVVGSMFTNDEMRIKTRFLFGTGPIDWRGVRRYTVA